MDGNGYQSVYFIIDIISLDPNLFFHLFIALHFRFVVVVFRLELRMVVLMPKTVPIILNILVEMKNMGWIDIFQQQNPLGYLERLLVCLIYSLIYKRNCR